MKEIWVDKRRAEVIDSPYFHVVFTLPHDLNPLIYRNQQLLYGFFHRCCAETLLELSADKKHLGATPGIIQVLHTWDQEINYHVHMHCIVSGGGLTPGHKLRKVKKNFFLRVEVLRDKFKGKFLAGLQSFFQNGRLFFQLPVKGSGILMNGPNSGIPFIKRTGALISKKLSTALATRLNIWAGIPIRSPYQTAASCLWMDSGSLFLPGAENPASHAGRLP